MTSWRQLALPALLVFAANSANAIQLGLLDDFEPGPDCATDNWAEGGDSSNPPTGELGCGELEGCCLTNVSSGGFGPGSRQVTYNESQWTGDYIAAGVNKIQMQIANPTAVGDLHVRIGVTNGTACYVSTDAVVLAGGNPGPGGLQFVSFFLDESTMTEVTGTVCDSPGTDSLADVLSNVTQLRIISAVAASWSGDSIDSVIEIDAIQSKADTDLDGVNDDVDNCTTFPNPSQLDTNEDGYGNACDLDLNDDCVTNFQDLGLFKSHFPPNPYNEIADVDGNGVIQFLDLARLKQTFFSSATPGPGPGLGACGPCVPPDSLGSNADFGGLEMFIRGGLVLDWGATAGINNFSDQTGGLYVARVELDSGDFEWKVADEGWSIEYCTTTNLVENTPTNSPLFGCAFPANGTITVPANGCYEFQMQTDGNVPPNSVDITFSPIGN